MGQILNNMLSRVKQIEQAKREWEATVDALPQLVLLLDHNQRIVRANRTVERWQLATVQTVQGLSVCELLHAAQAEAADGAALACDTCYMVAFLNGAWGALAQGQPATTEIFDEIIQQHLHIRLEPVKLSDNQRSRAVLIVENVTAQKQAEADLQAYAARLQHQNEELDAFAHTVAHNLRGPLMPIINYAQLIKLQHTSPSTEALEKDLDQIVINAHKIRKTINELLLLANVDHTTITMMPIDNMGSIIQDVWDTLSSHYYTNGVTPALITPTHWPIVIGHAPWIEEVWSIYVSNALKYGGQPLQVEVGANRLPDSMVRFWIRDNGPGIKPTEQSQLFQPFTRLNPNATTGHGLGLSIARRIIERLGGNVAVQSDGIPGHGSTFSFTLPSIGPKNQSMVL